MLNGGRNELYISPMRLTQLRTRRRADYQNIKNYQIPCVVISYEPTTISIV